jgi:hypothetical protein
VWTEEDVPPAHKIESDAVPPVWQGLLWGTVPIGVSFLAIFLELLLPGERRIPAGLGIPVRAAQPEEHFVA